MIKKALFLFLLGALCVGTALAGTKRDVTYQLDGKTAGAEIYYASLPGTTGGAISFSVYPTQLPDGSWGYQADIYWTEDGSAYNEVYGLLPASVVTAKGLQGPITVNITDQDFYIEPGSPFYDSGNFNSIEGTFTAYTGVGSYTYGQSGRYYSTDTHLDGSTETSTFNGTGKDQSATFEGTFVSNVTANDDYNLSLQGPYPQADFFVQVGTVADVITTP